MQQIALISINKEIFQHFYFKSELFEKKLHVDAKTSNFKNFESAPCRKSIGIPLTQICDDTNLFFT